AAPQIDDLALPPMFPLIANGDMAVALTDLAALARRPEYEPYSRRLVVALASQAVLSPAGPALAVAAQRLDEAPPDAELDGAAEDPRARRLARVAIAALGPTALVKWTGRSRPGMTLCVRDLCVPALEDAEELLHALVDVSLAPSGILASIRVTS